MEMVNHLEKVGPGSHMVGNDVKKVLDFDSKTILLTTFKMTSPLACQSPASPQKMDHGRNLPTEWKKQWDNAGNVHSIFHAQDSKSQAPVNTEGANWEDLPSWVPDWTKWSTKGPKAFPVFCQGKAAILGIW
jgi:hypothetical protein